ncbi:MAG TPA: Rne/Rng family ribonuclease [Candidatus Binatia bacterium]|nr:Rne/Rng family ribonuclease [Candidatus Binatia bacterium]
MSKVMLINVTHAEENRVAIVDNGVLESFEIESFSREHLKGNIYKATIHRVHAALDAAFVDIGGDRDAFLPLGEVCFRNLPDNGHAEGNGRRRTITDIFKSGQEVLVQIVKEEFGTKPPTVSTFYSLPGRYLVLLPGSEEAGISRRIEGEERIKLRQLIANLQPPPGCGIIVRTAAGFDQDSAELERDLSYLRGLWETIQQTAATKRAPALVYREHDLVLRNIRDYFTPDINEIFIDNEEVYQRALDFLRHAMPAQAHALHVYKGDQPIFSRFNVEAQIETIYKRRVPLKSGGSIVIDGTEALTAIDVNSGGSVRGGNQEETAFKTNREAALEIARQLRLRDLGGLVVIDFIDMRSQQHIQEVERTLRDAMRPDKAKHEIGRISRFGLLEVSRQRLRPAAAAATYTACPMCEGHGLVRTPESAALVALRKLHHRIGQGDLAAIKVTLPRDVAVYLLNQKRGDLAQLESHYGTRIQIALSDKLMPHQSEFEERRRTVTALEAPVQPGQVAATPAAAEPPANGGAAAPAAGANGATGTEGGRRRARRRGRRRGRGKLAAAAIAEALSALGGASRTPEPAAAELRNGREAEPSAALPPPTEAPESPTVVAESMISEAIAAAGEPVAAKPKRRRSRSTAGTRARTTKRTPKSAAGEKSASETPKRSTRAATTRSRSRRARPKPAPSES